MGFRLASMFGTRVEQRFTEGYDGTRIAYYVAGQGQTPWVLAPGLGTNILCWKYLFEEFASDYTMFTWDPRGTYASGVPKDLARLRVEDHCCDMVSVCNAEGLGRFIAGGWSMGVQIALEYYHRYPESVTALTLINGPYEHILSSALKFPQADKVLPLVFRLARLLEPLLSHGAARLLAWQEAPRLLIALGFLAEGTAGTAYFHEIMKEFSTLDFSVYLRMILLLHEHSAAAYLSEVKVPTIITAGTHDLMTPLATAERMHQQIPQSELYVIPHGTHYSMTEYPEVLHAGLASFLARLDSQGLTQDRSARRH